jgi:hypothetical protein
MGLTLDIYIIARLVTESVGLAMGIAISLLVVLAGLWYVLPHASPLREALRKHPERLT